MLNVLPSGIKAHRKIEILNYDTVSRWGRGRVGVDHETFITPIPTFPPQGGRRFRVLHPIAIGTSPEGEGFTPSLKGTLKRTQTHDLFPVFWVFSRPSTLDFVILHYIKVVPTGIG